MLSFKIVFAYLSRVGQCHKLFCWHSEMNIAEVSLAWSVRSVNTASDTTFHIWQWPHSRDGRIGLNIVLESVELFDNVWIDHGLGRLHDRLDNDLEHGWHGSVIAAQQLVTAVAQCLDVIALEQNSVAPRWNTFLFTWGTVLVYIITALASLTRCHIQCCH